MKKLLMLSVLLFIQYTSIVANDSDDSLVAKPYTKIIQKIASQDSKEELKNLQSEYQNTCIMCGDQTDEDDTQAPLLCISSDGASKKVIAQLRKLEEQALQNNNNTDLEAGQLDELITFKIHQHCQQHAHQVFNNNSSSPLMKKLCAAGVLAGGFCTVFLGGGFLFMAIQNSCEGEPGMYHCHSC